VPKAAPEDQSEHTLRSIRYDLLGGQEEETYRTEETQQSEKEFGQKNQKRKIRGKVQWERAK